MVCSVTAIVLEQRGDQLGNAEYLPSCWNSLVDSMVC